MFITKFLTKNVDKYNLKRHFSAEQYAQMLPRFDEDSKIANNIFQIYLLGNGASAESAISRLTPDFIDNIEKIKKNNPEYKYQLFSDQEAKRFILRYYGAVIWDYYQRIDKAYLASKADFLRYLLLYAYGGVYLDLKSTIELPLSTTLHNDDQFLYFYWPGEGRQNYLLPQYIIKGEMLQSFIIAARGNLLLREVILNVLHQIDWYNPFRDGVEWMGTLSTTGPVIYTKTIYHMITQFSNRFYREGELKQFGYKMHFSGLYTPGIYQKELSMKDYRKTSRPVIRCNQKCLQAANVCWLKVLNKYTRLKRGKVK